MSERKRREAILQQSYKTDGSKYPVDYVKSDAIKNAMYQYVPGDDMHHMAGIDIMEPIFANTSQQQAALLAEFAESIGMPVGDHPLNFVSLPTGKVHQSGMHGYMLNNNIQLSPKQKENYASFLNNLRNASFSDKRRALQVFAEQGQPIIDDRLKSLGYGDRYPTRNQLKDIYKKKSNQELSDLRRLGNKETLNTVVESTAGSKNVMKKLDVLLDLISNDNMAGSRLNISPQMMQGMRANNINKLQTQGVVVGNVVNK